MIVKAVVPVDKRKCKVFLEGDFAFVLYKSEAARFHIEEGNDLPAKTYEMIEEEILLKRARDRALYLLQSQGRTQAEMIKKIKKMTVIHSQLRSVYFHFFRNTTLLMTMPIQKIISM